MGSSGVVQNCGKVLGSRSSSHGKIVLEIIRLGSLHLVIEFVILLLFWAISKPPLFMCINRGKIPTKISNIVMVKVALVHVGPAVDDFTVLTLKVTELKQPILDHKFVEKLPFLAILLSVSHL